MPRRQQISSMGTALRAMVRYAEQHDIDIAHLVAASGIDASTLADPKIRLPDSVASPLFDAIIDASGDPDLHFRVAEQIPFGAFRVIDFTAGSAATVGEGFAALARYFCIVHTGTRMEVEVEGDARRFVHSSTSGPGFGAVSLAITAMRFAGLTSPAVRPRRAELVRRPLKDPALARRLFGDQIVYSAPRDMLVYDAAQFARPLERGDAALHDVLSAHAETLRSDFAQPPSLAESVAIALQPLLGQGRAELRHAARALGLSPRTLQRRLRADRTSFQAVLDETRRALAQHYLRDRGLTVLEVAFMLGYSDESAFHRAFKRWFGQQPGAWRAAAG